MSERIVVTCDRCKRDFCEDDPSGKINPNTNAVYRRDSKIIVGQLSVDLCTPCEQVATVAEIRTIVTERLARLQAQR